MAEIHIYTKKDLDSLTKDLGPDFLYHGTPQTFGTLGRLAEGDEIVLMPHLARNRDSTTGMHVPRHPKRLMSVGFHDGTAAGSSAMRALLHPYNHPSLAPVDCAHGYDITADGEMQYRATDLLADDVTEETTGSLFTTTIAELEDVNYALPGFIPDGDHIKDFTGKTGSDSHDYWAMGPIAPHDEHEIIVHGTFFLRELAIGNVAISEPFRPDYNQV